MMVKIKGFEAGVKEFFQSLDDGFRTETLDEDFPMHGKIEFLHKPYLWSIGPDRAVYYCVFTKGADIHNYSLTVENRSAAPLTNSNDLDPRSLNDGQSIPMGYLKVGVDSLSGDSVHDLVELVIGDLLKHC